MAEVEEELVGHVMRDADGLDVLRVVEGRAEEQQRHVVIRCDVVVAPVHPDLADGADLGVSSWSRQHIKSRHHTEIASADPSGKRKE